MLKKIERTEVKSSNIKSVGYDCESRCLDVEFKSGSVYRYIEIPHSVYELKIQNADSIGSVISNFIVKAGFNSIKMDGLDMGLFYQHIAGLKTLVDSGKLPNAKQLENLLLASQIVVGKKVEEKPPVRKRKASGTVSKKRKSLTEKPNPRSRM